MALCLSLLSWYLHESFFYKYTLFILYYSERGDWSPLDSETTLYGKHEKLFIYVKHHFVCLFAICKYSFAQFLNKLCFLLLNFKSFLYIWGNSPLSVIFCKCILLSAACLFNPVTVSFTK